MPRKGTCGAREGCERKSYSGDRIEELERELGESEANLTGVPELRERYIKPFFFSVWGLTGDMQHRRSQESTFERGEASCRGRRASRRVGEPCLYCLRLLTSVTRALVSQQKLSELATENQSLRSSLEQITLALDDRTSRYAP